jgi:hypothetical protein
MEAHLGNGVTVCVEHGTAAGSQTTAGIIQQLGIGNERQLKTELRLVTKHGTTLEKWNKDRT